MFIGKEKRLNNLFNKWTINFNAVIIYPTYFASIIQYAALVNENEILFEVEDSYQKQTYRNRCYIYGSNGKQLLTVPIIHSRNKINYKTKDIRIDHSSDWQKLHIRSLQSAYRSSPFYEFYEDEVIAIFDKKHNFLLDLDLDVFQVINECLELDVSYRKSIEYQVGTLHEGDYRHLVNAKNDQKYPLKKYTQVFDDKHGYISNLSILDLLFNEGPNALEYLEDHKKLLF